MIFNQTDDGQTAWVVIDHPDGSCSEVTIDIHEFLSVDVDPSSILTEVSVSVNEEEVWASVS